MSKIEIDFNTLKYNLYEILNIKSDSDESKIRKNFIKLIKTFHPDKNSNLEEDIYYHIILSNQILLNKDLRIKYDAFLEAKINNFNDLKLGFNNCNNSEKKKLNNDAIKEFNNKVNQLNKTHNILDYLKTTDDVSTIDKYNNLISSRNNINIDKKEFKSVKEFNNIFYENKINGNFKDQLVEYNDKNNELNTYSGESYRTLNHIEKLYLNDSITTNNYSSLDRAFNLIPIINNNNNKTMKEKINDYEYMTKEYKNPSFHINPKS